MFLKSFTESSNHPDGYRAWISRWENGKIRKKKWFSQGNSAIFILCFIYWGLVPYFRVKVLTWNLETTFGCDCFLTSLPTSMSFRTQPLPHHLCARCLNSVPTWIRCFQGASFLASGRQTEPRLSRGQESVVNLNTVEWLITPANGVEMNSKALGIVDYQWMIPSGWSRKGLGKQLFLTVHSESFLKDYDVESRSMPLLAWLLLDGPLPIICPCCWWNRYRASKQG